MLKEFHLHHSVPVQISKHFCSTCLDYKIPTDLQLEKKLIASYVAVSKTLQYTYLTFWKASKSYIYPIAMCSPLPRIRIKEMYMRHAGRVPSRDAGIPVMTRLKVAMNLHELITVLLTQCCNREKNIISICTQHLNRTKCHPTKCPKTFQP